VVGEGARAVDEEVGLQGGDGEAGGADQPGDVAVEMAAAGAAPL